MMRIYGAGASPFVQRVLLAGRLKGVEIEALRPPGGLGSPEMKALNPLGRIPVLDHDGWLLAESGAILSYLDRVLPGAPLYSADPREAARARMIEEFATSELPGLIQLVFRPQLAAAELQTRRERAAAGFAAIERSLVPDGPYLLGEAPGAADCIVFPFLQLARISHATTGLLDLLTPFPGLRRYLEQAASHPALAYTATTMEERVAQRLAALQAAAG